MCPSVNSEDPSAIMNSLIYIRYISGDISKCRGLSDGFYSEGCSQHYFGCANGEIFYMSCPPNLVFDSRAGTCEEGEDVPECRFVMT